MLTLEYLVEKHRRHTVMEFLKDRKLMAAIFVILSGLLSAIFGIDAYFTMEDEPAQIVEAVPELEEL